MLNVWSKSWVGIPFSSEDPHHIFRRGFINLHFPLLGENIPIGVATGNPHVRIHKGYHTACQRLVQFNVHCSLSKGPHIVMGQFTDKKLPGKMKRSDGSPQDYPRIPQDTSTTVYPTSRISRIVGSPTCDEVSCLVPNHLNVSGGKRITNITLKMTKCQRKWLFLKPPEFLSRDISS